ncbi:MAG: DUF4230 domain-containing protein [Clostridia bacterium]|nr:DUF4230 domain-containing protein [Clostridia bacterium]
MKKILLISALLVITFLSSSCGKKDVELDIGQMKRICELAVKECHYHTVAKYTQEDVSRFLWLTKDKHFWVEYDCVVTFGIDVNELDIKVSDDVVTIALPNAKVLSAKVKENTLSKESYIVAKGSAKITAEDGIAAYNESVTNVEEEASKDKYLLDETLDRVKSLLTGYINNIDALTGTKHTIEWIAVEDENVPTAPTE